MKSVCMYDIYANEVSLNIGSEVIGGTSKSLWMYVQKKTILHVPFSGHKNSSQFIKFYCID